MPSEITITYLWLATLTMFVVTYGLRSFVFAAFGGGQKPPAVILYIGAVISPAIIAALIVYCFKGTSLQAPTYGLPELLATLTCILLHIWKRNPLFSIIISTLLYMLLVQKVFV